MQRINLRSQGDIYIDQLSTRHNSQQYRQCTYKLTLKCFRVAIVVGKQKVLHIMGVCL